MKRMLLGVGNRLSQDDGVGPDVAAGLQASAWLAIDCGTSLENASGIVAREHPDLLVIVDAAEMGLKPGDVRRLPIRFRDRMLASTHGLPLPFVLDRMASHAGELCLIGVQPECMAFGNEGLSPAVAQASRTLIQLLLDNDLDWIPFLDVPT